MATRDDPDADFDAPVPLDEVNLAKFADSDPWVSPDGRVLYFTSAREGLRRNIYRAER